MDLLAIVTIALLFLVMLAVAGALNGSGAYIGWGLASAAFVLILYMTLVR